MAAFRPADRVRIRDTPRTTLDAGKIATVVWIKEDRARGVVMCQVRLDGNHPVYTVLQPDELEPAPEHPP